MNGFQALKKSLHEIIDLNKQRKPCHGCFLSVNWESVISWRHESDKVAKTAGKLVVMNDLMKA